MKFSKHFTAIEEEEGVIKNPFSWDGQLEPLSDDYECCTHCGKPMKSKSKTAWVHVIDGGENLAPASWDDNDPRIDEAGNMLWFQVGPTCKLMVPAAYRKMF